MTEIDYACRTHIGLVRETNEDAYFADPELGLWVVADGMGGHLAGEVASGIVVRELPQSIRRGESLTDAIEMTHLLIQMAADQAMVPGRMGSTVVALRLEGLRYEIAWVGDSRAYLWDGAQLRRLTKDHSYVQLLLDMGIIMEEEVYTHPSRNVISQGLGVGGMEGDVIKADKVEGVLGTGDTLLLCSDGLSGAVRDSAIARIMSQAGGIHARLDRLIEAALAAGGLDNITAILVSPRQS